MYQLTSPVEIRHPRQIQPTGTLFPRKKESFHPFEDQNILPVMFNIWLHTALHSSDFLAKHSTKTLQINL